MATVAVFCYPKSNLRKHNMNKIIRIAIVSLLLSNLIAIPTQAAFYDWMKLSKTADEKIELPQSSDWSFDSLYSNIKNVGMGSVKNGNIGSASVVGASAPITIKKAKVSSRTFKVSASAYSSTKDQTDDSPFITASGTYVRDGIIAANFLPFGTAVKIPEIYGDKIFIVEDRMNSRYWYNVDIWFPERSMAKDFGRKTVTIEVVS